MSKIELIKGNCLEEMKKIPSGSIDLILCDLPYGTTDCKWDEIIPFEPLWAQYKRIIRPGGVIALFGSEPFSSKLRMSNMGWFRYDWIWNKKCCASFANAKRLPLKIHEIVSIFYNSGDTRNTHEELKSYMRNERQKAGISNGEIKQLLGNTMASHYFTNGSQFVIPSQQDYEKLQSTGCFNMPYEELKAKYDAERVRTEYNPQGLVELKNPKRVRKNNAPEIFGETSGMTREYIQRYTNYPKSIITYGLDYTGLHPTAKPVALLEYIIQTYTQEGDTVLDNCMGSGSTGVACVHTNRNFIGIEMDEHYFTVAKERIKKEQQTNENSSDLST